MKYKRKIPYSLSKAIIGWALERTESVTISREHIFHSLSECLGRNEASNAFSLMYPSFPHLLNHFVNYGGYRYSICLGEATYAKIHTKVPGMAGKAMFVAKARQLIDDYEKDVDRATIGGVIENAKMTPALGAFILENLIDELQVRSLSVKSLPHIISTRFPSGDVEEIERALIPVMPGAIDLLYGTGILVTKLGDNPLFPAPIHITEYGSDERMEAFYYKTREIHVLKIEREINGVVTDDREEVAFARMDHLENYIYYFVRNIWHERGISKYVDWNAIQNHTEIATNNNERLRFSVRTITLVER
ncbi:MAG: hypothetical protein D6698_02165 [Gammaproteobacteria bacterium]|nr:MAG: hypothetical protein D6698_02165 [Gammaproteobacteria bacterium]